MDTMLEEFMADAKLPSLPDVYLRLKQVLDDPDSSMIDVANVVGNDPAMTARLLQIVNSAYFGLAAEIDTVSRAVNLLGTQEVHDLVLAVSVAQSFAGIDNQVMDMHRFWRRSVVCAVSAKELASLCNVLDGDRLFVCGLLRDIGHLLIYQRVPQHAVQAIELARSQNAPLYETERSVIGVDYATLGAALLRRWKLPRTLWEPTAFHIEPTRSEEFKLSTAIVHIAAVLADTLDAGGASTEGLGAVSSDAWQMTKLDAGQCVAVLDAVDGQVASVTRMLFPGVRAA